MTRFDDWCEETEGTANGHDFTMLVTIDGGHEIGVDLVSKIVPTHYVSNEKYARMLKMLGKPSAAKYLQTKMPLKKRGRSGDLGEILAITYVKENTIWDQMVEKLRWSDHREMPMRGDDLLAVGIVDGEIQFLKGEAKSRAKLATKPITDARESLEKDEGRPTPHALSFLSDRLAEEGRHDISDRINSAQFRDGIALKNLTQMIFTFSGNNPKAFLVKDLNSYSGDVDQFSIGLRVPEHQKFIHDVYSKVIDDGDA
ncbi:MAG: hypothetical protein COB24_12885 [Hyphomicrobiales bacterium]|nr:MAG: hypothetical protein COB24_12885 [Hyphomicrobiales bacterium]